MLEGAIMTSEARSAMNSAGSKRPRSQQIFERAREDSGGRRG